MKKLHIAAALGGILAMGSAQALVIDDFNSGSFTGTAPITGQGVPGAPFTRTLDASGTGNMTIDINSGLNVGVYAHSQDTGVTGISSLTYDLGGLDLNNDANAFRVDVRSVDLSGTLTIEVDGVPFSLNTTSLVFANGGPAPLSADFLFSDFAGVNFDNVSSVKLIVDGTTTAALDASIDNFGTVCTDANISGLGGNINTTLCNTTPPPSVPEPAPLALLGAGMIGLLGFRRRK